MHSYCLFISILSKKFIGKIFIFPFKVFKKKRIRSGSKNHGTNYWYIVYEIKFITGDFEVALDKRKY